MCVKRKPQVGKYLLVPKGSRLPDYGKGENLLERHFGQVDRGQCRDRQPWLLPTDRPRKTPKTCEIIFRNGRK